MEGVNKMLNVQELKELALHSVRGTVPANFSLGTVDEALRGELSVCFSSITEFERNKLDLFEIIMDTADEYLPNKVIAGMGPFAEVKVVAQGQKAVFKRGVGRMRAKKFLTQVGLSGVYETFRLDSETFTVSAHAIGGQARIDFERFLDGEENLADLMDIILEGLEDAVYGEVQRALKASVSQTGRPTANYVVHNGFDGSKMAKLCATVRAYGQSATIFAPPEFILDMGPDAIVSGIASTTNGIYSPKDIEAIHDRGYINIFRGTPVVQIPQSFVDEDNVKTWIDPQLAYVMPTGGEKVVKVVLEGKTQVNDFKNRDNSIEISAYKKIGAAIMTFNNWGIYQNTSIAQTMESPYGF